jgi:hypothetical protein
LIGLALAIPALQVALKYIHYQYPIEFYLYRTIGPHNGFWQAAIAIESLGDYLRTYPEQMREALDQYVHLATPPPGLILYMYGWRRLFELLPNAGSAVAHWLRGYNCADFAFVTLEDAQIAAALGQMVTPLLSGLTVFPLYLWVKDLVDERAGWRAALIFTLAPSLSAFTLRWDSIYPFFAASAFAALHYGLRRRRLWGRALLWYIAGSMVSTASFASLGNAPLALGMPLYALVYLWLERDDTPVWKQVMETWPAWLALIAGGYTVWALNHLLTGVALWDILAITAGVQADLQSSYSYFHWFFYNLYDFLTFAGIAVSTFFVAQALRGWLLLPKRGTAIATLPAVTASGILLFINILGVSPGEVGRLWLYWAIPMIAATVGWLKNQSRNSGTSTAVVIGLMALQTLWVALFLRVTPTGMPSYNPREASGLREIPTAATPSAVIFDQQIALLGYQVEPEEDLVTLYWRADRRPDLQYTVFVHALDASGKLVGQDDAMPVGNSLPTSCWLPGEIVEDPHTLMIPSEAEMVQVGLYYWPTMERLTVADSEATDTIQIPIKP